MTDKQEPGRRSASAEAAALRRAKQEDEEPELPPRLDEQDEQRGPRRSASAEAAALRYERDHPDDDD